MLSVKPIIAASAACAPGSFAETGGAVIFKAAAPAAFGSFAETGEAAVFKTGSPLGFGHYVLLGEAAAFSASNAIFTAFAFGAFALTGEGAAFGVKTPAAFGSFVETGRAAAFGTLFGAALAAGHYILTGDGAAFASTATWAKVAPPAAGWQASQYLGNIQAEDGTAILLEDDVTPLTTEGTAQAAWVPAARPSSVWTKEPS